MKKVVRVLFSNLYSITKLSISEHDFHSQSMLTALGYPTQPTHREVDSKIRQRAPEPK